MSAAADDMGPVPAAPPPRLCPEDKIHQLDEIKAALAEGRGNLCCLRWACELIDTLAATEVDA